MEVDLIFRIAAIGIIVSVLYQVLLIYEISGLFDTVKEVFGLVVLWKLPL